MDALNETMALELAERAELAEARAEAAEAELARFRHPRLSVVSDNPAPARHSTLTYMNNIGSGR